MKTTKNYLVKAIAFMAILFVMLTPNAALAQTGFAEDVDDQAVAEPAAPINNYALAGIVAAIAVGYVTLAKKRQAA